MRHCFGSKQSSLGPDFIEPVGRVQDLYRSASTSAVKAGDDWWSWLALSVPEDAEAGGGLMVAVVQLSIALGSTLGGVLFDSRGYQTTFGAAAVLLIDSAVAALLTA
ncbi:hypothetical protein PS910_02471 [Pseudomonas fluorescens]|nr:hypothetical protein PS910_02471 [Pseudomonas fluorescens]